MKSYFAAIVAVLLWFLVWDNVLGQLLVGPAMASIPGMLPEFSKFWETVGDLFAAVILTGLYARVRGVFGANTMGGAVYGVYAGLLIHFPTWLFMTVYAAWPYGATWKLTIGLVAFTVVAGAIMGTVYQMTGGAPAGQKAGS